MPKNFYNDAFVSVKIPFFIDVLDRDSSFVGMTDSPYTVNRARDAYSLTIHYSLFTSHHSLLPTAFCLLTTAYCPLTTHHSPLTTH